MKVVQAWSSIGTACSPLLLIVAPSFAGCSGPLLEAPRALEDSGATVVVGTEVASPGAEAASPGSDAALLSQDETKPDAPAEADAAPEASPAVTFEGGSSVTLEGGSAAAWSIRDDFESGSLAMWTLTDPYGNPLGQSGQSTVAVDSTRAHTGKSSVKVTGGGFLGISLPSSSFFGRVWVWLGADPGTGHWAWVDALGPSSSGAARTEVRLGGHYGILEFNYFGNDAEYLSDPSFFDDGMSGGAHPTVGAWTCVEFGLSKDSIALWIDGSSAPTMQMTPATSWGDGTKAPWSPPYDFVRIGFHNYNGSDVDVWLDDVALGTTRVGCL